MSAFQRSTMAQSCLSACEIERIHIFEDGSSPLGAETARGGNTISEKREEQVLCEHTPFAAFPFSSSWADVSESMVKENLGQSLGNRGHIYRAEMSPFRKSSDSPGQYRPYRAQSCLRVNHCRQDIPAIFVRFFTRLLCLPSGFFPARASISGILLRSFPAPP